VNAQHSHYASAPIGRKH